MSAAPRATVRLGHLYPAEMNIYADRGNIAVLARRLEWRGHALEVTALGPGERVDPGAHDLYYLGGGQDRDQLWVAEDMAATKGEGLRAAVADGAAMLCVCGGFQLAGDGYTGVDGARMPGAGARPLGRVVHGHGNNGEDGGEGAVQRRVIGTYLHGPLLPRNPWLADLLLRWALEHAGVGSPDLAPLDDAVEDAAREVAAVRAARHRDR